MSRTSLSFCWRWRVNWWALIDGWWYFLDVYKLHIAGQFPTMSYCCSGTACFWSSLLFQEKCQGTCSPVAIRCARNIAPLPPMGLYKQLLSRFKNYSNHSRFVSDINAQFMCTSYINQSLLGYTCRNIIHFKRWRSLFRRDFTPISSQESISPKKSTAGSYVLSKAE